jgi:biofilm protein TabA
MIIDYIDNLEEYKTHKYYKFLQQIKNTNWVDLPDGKVKLDNDNYYGIDSLNTKDKSLGFWESHKKYVDIHYIISGEEIIGYENIRNLELDNAYNPEKDLITYKGSVNNPILMKAGMFAILTQQDAHMPNIYIEGASKLLRKVVFKLN